MGLLIIFLILLFVAFFPGLFAISAGTLYWGFIFLGSIIAPIILLGTVAPELYKLLFRWKEFYNDPEYDRDGRRALAVTLSLTVVVGIALTGVLWNKLPAAYNFFF